MTRLLSRLHRPGASGGSAVNYATYTLDMTEHDTPQGMLVLPIPEGSTVISARLSPNRPPPPAGQGAIYMLLLGGEDALVFVRDPLLGDEQAVYSGGPGQVGEAGVIAGVLVASLDEPDGWEAEWAYDVGEKVSANGHIYVCTQAGTSAPYDDEAEENGPSGTGSGIEDGSVIWDWESALPTLADWGQSVSFEVAWVSPS